MRLLRLVHSRTDETALPAPQRVALWGLDEELASYICHHLRQRWPALTVIQGDPCKTDGADLIDFWICGHPPPVSLQVPTLWLGALDRSQSAARLDSQQWTCSAPLTGRKLLRSVQQIFAPAAR